MQAHVGYDQAGVWWVRARSQKDPQQLCPLPHISLFYFRCWGELYGEIQAQDVVCIFWLHIPRPGWGCPPAGLCIWHIPRWQWHSLDFLGVGCPLLGLLPWCAGIWWKRLISDGVPHIKLLVVSRRKSVGKKLRAKLEQIELQGLQTDLAPHLLRPPYR